VYSFAIIFWELLAGEEVWREKKRSHLILLAVAEGERPSPEKIAEEGLRDTINDCWHHDPHSRPEFVDIFFRLTHHAEEKGRGKSSVPGSWY
jgi:Protein tyrosine and serine/threonine kinase